MTPENRRIPDWARRERQHDMDWIRENLYIFWPTATHAYVELGRGAIVVDTTSQPGKGQGHPFGYLPQAEIEARDDEDVKRMVRQYDPDSELVVVMLKAQDRMSTYRVQVRSRQGNR